MLAATKLSFIFFKYYLFISPSPSVAYTSFICQLSNALIVQPSPVVKVPTMSAKFPADGYTLVVKIAKSPTKTLWALNEVTRFEQKSVHVSRYISVQIKTLHKQQ